MTGSYVRRRVVPFTLVVAGLFVAVVIGTGLAAHFWYVTLPVLAVVFFAGFHSSRQSRGR